MSPAERPNVRQAVPFFRVTSIDASLRFYLDGLGFRITRRWEPDGQLRWCWLELGEVAMMLQTFEKDAPERQSPGNIGRGVSIAFQCEDALALHRDARAKGLSPQEPSVGNGLWVVVFRDPDGYALEFASPTKVAEDMTLSEWEAGQAKDG